MSLKINFTGNLILSIFSAAMLSLPFTAPGLDFLPWFALIPLLFVIESSGSKKAFFFSYIAGLVFFLISIFWLTNVTAAGWLVLCLYLSLYFGFFGLLANIILKKGKVYEPLLLLPCLWVAFEFLRSHFLSGFGWNSLGYSQSRNLALIQIADFSGVYGVSFLVVFVNCAVWLIFKTRAKRPALALFLGLALSIVLAYGIIRLNENFSDSKKTLRVSVIEPNIAQELKWDPSARIYILQTLRDLSLAAASENPDMIIWPESAVPDFFTDDPFDFVEISELAKVLDKNILTGVVKDSQDKYYNSALLISGQGNIVKEYDKLHLVPYGEFIPFRRLTPYLAAVVGIGDFTPGEEYTIFSIKANERPREEITFSVLICFEDAFPELSRRFIKSGALILVNITNDAWFGRGAQPLQHLSQSVFRAVENRTSVVRCANTGISGLIDANGRASIISDKINGKEIFPAGFKTFSVQAKTKNLSFYSLFGDCFAYICVILALSNIIFWFLKERS